MTTQSPGVNGSVRASRLTLRTGPPPDTSALSAPTSITSANSPRHIGCHLLSGRPGALLVRLRQEPADGLDRSLHRAAHRRREWLAVFHPPGLDPDEHQTPGEPVQRAGQLDRRCEAE